MIKGKTPEEIRKTFNIKNDFTEEEEAQVCYAIHRLSLNKVLCMLGGINGSVMTHRVIKPLDHIVSQWILLPVVLRYAKRTSGVKRSKGEILPTLPL